MSATTSDIPPSVLKKKRRSSNAYRNSYDVQNPTPYTDTDFPKVSGLFNTNTPSMSRNVMPSMSRDILEPTVDDFKKYVSSILKKKSDVIRAVDTSRHTMEKATTQTGSTALSIVKRNKVPSSQAVAIFSAQKMVSTPIFHPATQAVGNVANVNQNQYVSTVSQNKNMSKKQQNPFGSTPVYDAKYTEMVDEIVNELESSGKYKVSSKPEFAKAPARDVRDLDLAQRSKSVEPEDFAAISATKNKIKKSIVKRPTKQVTAAGAFDHLVDVFTGKGKSGKSGEVQTAPQKKGHSLKSHIVHGIQDVNEICEEIGKNPNLIRIKQQQEADIKYIRSAGKRARGLIAADSNVVNKRGMTAGSLITQHILCTITRNNTYDTTNPYGISAIYEKGFGGRTELHFYYKNHRISHERAARVLTHKQIHALKIEALSNGTSTAPAQANQENNNNHLNTKRNKTASKLVRRNHGGLVTNEGGNKTLNKPKVTTNLGLIRRTKSGVV